MVKDYAQDAGVDFEEVFASIARFDTIQLIVSLAAQFECKLYHRDVKSAFLNGEIEEEVFVTQPEHFMERGKEHLVLKLKKALYRLR